MNQFENYHNIEESDHAASQAGGAALSQFCADLQKQDGKTMLKDRTAPAEENSCLECTAIYPPSKSTCRPCGPKDGGQLPLPGQEKDHVPQIPDLDKILPFLPSNGETDKPKSPPPGCRPLPDPYERPLLPGERRLPNKDPEGWECLL